MNEINVKKTKGKLYCHINDRRKKDKKLKKLTSKKIRSLTKIFLNKFIK